MRARILCALLLSASLFAQQSSPQAPTVTTGPWHPVPEPQPAASANPSQSSSAARQGFRIAGTVVNSLTGQPISGVSVAIAPVTQAAERDISNSVVTGADGRFSFAGLSRGKYSLMARARGTSLEYFEHHGPYSTAIAVGPDLDSEHLVFRLQAEASIEGDITDDNNDPIQYAQVRLFEKSMDAGQQKTRPMNQAQTDDLGHYHIGHLAPGAYYLAVSARPWYAQNTHALTYHQDYKQNFTGAQSAPPQDDAALDVTYPLTFYPDAYDWTEATPIQLAPGEKETANVVLRAVPSLHLRIHTGAAAQDAVIGRMIFPHVSQYVFEGYLDSVYNAPNSWVAPGVIEISGLAPGHYVIEVPPSTGPNNKSPARGWYREVDLAGDAEISAADAPGFVTIQGTVLFENARVPRHAAIEILNQETGEAFRSEIGANGEFDFRSDEVRPGRYLIFMGSRDFYLKKLVATGAKINGHVVEIPAAATVHVAAIATRGQGQVEGTAMREDKPFSGAMVVLVPQDPANNVPLFRRDQSDSDGTFTLPSVVPGQYTVIAIANGWDLEWGNPAVLQPYLKRGEVVQVPPDGKLQVKVQVQ